MRASRPVVAILTDGSGRGSKARLELSRDVCRRASATISDRFGMATDEEIYRAILGQDTTFFLDMASMLAALLVEREIDCVAGDAMEGYNPTHDLCRRVIDRAVRLAARARKIDNYAFDLVGSSPQASSGANVLRIDLSPEDLALKLEVCRAYAASAGGTLLAEVESMLQERDETFFARECLVPVDAWSQSEPPPDYRPFYEVYGEQQVAAGHYSFVIRHREHVWPIARALQT